MAFADLPKNRTGPSQQFLGPHLFDRVCIEHGCLTKPYHPWTNSQAERMNRTIKVFHYDDIESLKAQNRPAPPHLGTIHLAERFDKRVSTVPDCGDYMWRLLAKLR
ncbi:hypothetical protein FHR87_003717 [Azomonas macrocytogenes]|uniref:Integrase catalytic domain-containing protein n=1 Tax=Azomonas macrocytogenes TaxID=69962 RepID=A0A839T725_AZOMA|nr:hypothetical protein [Azomonas macrocytogenes]